LKINPEFKSLIPPLTESEYKQLESNLLQDGCLMPLVTWNDTIIDGHNRFEICQKHNLPFETKPLIFDDVDTVKIWIIDNQNGRRNLADFQRYELKKAKADILAEMGKERMSAGGKGLSITDKPSEEPHNTQKIIADELNWSTGKVAQADIVDKKADEPTKQKLRSGEITINKAYQEVKKQEQKEKIELIKINKPTVIDGLYDVIVIDPPWPMKKIDRDVRPNQKEFDYPTMDIKEISNITIPAGPDCHLWMWTTQKFLPDAFQILSFWGFRYVCCFVWHKPGGFQPVKLPQYNCEFVLYARKGTPEFIDTKSFFTCFNADRKNHSEKPEIFYDVVRRVTSGRRLDMFSRRIIDGFDVWGNEVN